MLINGPLVGAIAEPFTVGTRPNANSSQNGRFIYLTDTHKYQMCINGNWADVYPQTPSSGGYVQQEVTLTTFDIVKSYEYVINNASLVTGTLPAVAAAGDRFRIAGRGTGGWKIAQRTGQSIVGPNKTTEVGTGGYIQSGINTATVEVVCIVADTVFKIVDGCGDILIHNALTYGDGGCWVTYGH